MSAGTCERMLSQSDCARITDRYPSFIASRTRRSGCVTERSSPVRPTSPKATVWGSSGRLR